MKGNKIADNRNNHEKKFPIEFSNSFWVFRCEYALCTCILTFTIKSSHLFYSAFLSKPEWITFQFVFVLVRQQVKIRVNFFLQRKKNYPYHKNSHRYQQTSTNSNGKKIQRKKKNRFKNMHFTIKVGRWRCWQTMHQFNYSVGPDIDDRLLMVLTKSIRINAVCAGIFTFSLLFS